MLERPTSTYLTVVLVLAVFAHVLIADPSQTALLSTDLSLSGRLGDPEAMVDPFGVSDAVVLENGGGDADEFASGDPFRSGDSNETAATATANVIWESSAPGLGSDFTSGGADSADTLTEASFLDYKDTLVRSEQNSRVQTLAGRGSGRFPDSWAVPPGSAVPGGYPGDRRTVPTLDYSVEADPAYYPPRSIENSYRGAAYAYPNPGGYHPGGPYAYQYDGLVPLEDSSYSAESDYEFDWDFPLFTRKFDPESAHLKAGPFYFEALWVGSGVLYSDYHGPANFAPGQEDGWLGYSSFGFRMSARVNPSLYLTVAGEVIYVYGENELGFRSGFGGGPFASLVYETQVGTWDIRAYAEFGTGSLHNFFGSEAYDRAGRYSFGFYGRYDDGLLYDPYLYTRVGVDATTLVDPDWRLTLEADHTDYWYVGNDRGDDHRAREHAGALLGAEPDSVPFSPWLSYDLYSNDYFDSVHHLAYLGGSGRLSRNVFVDGRVGYFWNTNDLAEHEHWLWNMGIRHQINERTTHGVRFGQDFFMSDFAIDSAVSSFFQYYITHDVTDRLRLHGYAQWSTDEFLTGPFVGGEYESELYGIWVHYDFTDRLKGSLGYLEEERRNTRTGYEFDRSLFQARLNARIGERTTGYILYQHEDTDVFYEDLYMAGVRRYF